MFAFLRNRGAAVAFTFGVLVLPGCGPGTPPELEVRGSVTLDKTPLADGAITFLTPEGVAAGGGPVKDGAFTARLKPGTYKVSITGSRPVPGKVVPGMGTPLLESVVPARYNSATTLTADVSPDRTEFAFPLESQPGKGKRP